MFSHLYRHYIPDNRLALDQFHSGLKIQIYNHNIYFSLILLTLSTLYRECHDVMSNMYKTCHVSFMSGGDQYIQLVKVLYCKLPTMGKQLLIFPHVVSSFDDDIGNLIGVKWHWVNLL